MQSLKEIKSILSDLAVVNNQIIIEAGLPFSVASPAKDALIFSKVNSSFDFAIYDINNFISIISLADEKTGTVEIEDKFAVIKDDKVKLKYLKSKPTLLTPTPRNLKMLEIEDFKQEVNVDSSDLKNMLQITSALNLDKIIFTFTAGSDNLIISSEGNTTDTNNFELKIKLDYIPTESNSYIIDKSKLKINKAKPHSFKFHDKFMRIESDTMVLLFTY